MDATVCLTWSMCVNGVTGYYGNQVKDCKLIMNHELCVSGYYGNQEKGCSLVIINLEWLLWQSSMAYMAGPFVLFAHL